MLQFVPRKTNLLFGDAATGAGEGIERWFEPSWTWAPWITVLFAIAAAAFVIWVYANERGEAKKWTRGLLVSLRLVLIAMVVVVMLGWVLHRDRTDLPDLIIIFDDSQSMLHNDQYVDSELQAALHERVQAVGLSQPTRINLAKTLLIEDDGDLLDSLRRKYNVKLYRVGGSARAESSDADALVETVRLIDAEQPVSRLGNGLREILEAQRGRPTAAIVILSDGVTTEGKSLGEVAHYARRKAVPLFTVGIGNDQPTKDLRLSDLLVDDVVFVNDLVAFQVKLTGVGFDGKPATVKLHEKSKTTTLAQERVAVGPDGVVKSVRLAYRPDTTGEFEYVVEVEPLEGEVTTDNNQVSRIVSVRDETIRVLLVQAYPSFEYRFLKTLLGRQLRESDKSSPKKSIALTIVLQEADKGFAEADDAVHRALPVRREDLFEYDVIIFGDVDPSGLGRQEMQNIVDFVKVRGGGVAFIAGPRYTLSYRDTPLAGLLPVDLNSAVAPNPDAFLNDKFPFQPTQLGMASPQMQLGDTTDESLRIWRSLDGLYWLLETPDVKDGARILAEHPTRTGSDGRNLPIALVQFVGAGKVIFHATDETYRWRYRMGDKHFARYWIQTIRYLSRSALLGKNRTAEVTSDRDEYRRGESVYLRVRFLDDRQAPAQDDGVTVVLESADGTRRNITPQRDPTDRGMFEAALTNLAEGNYHAWVATPTLAGNPPSHRFLVVAPPGEQARLEMNSADLQLAADTSQGKHYTIHDTRSLLDDLPAGRQERIGSLPPLSIWSQWQVTLAFGAAFVILIAAEWLLRKKCGML